MALYGQPTRPGMPSSRSPRTNAFPTVQTGLGIGRSSRCNCTILVNLRLLLILLRQTHIRSLYHRGRQIVFSIDPEPQLLILLLFYINKDAGNAHQAVYSLGEDEEEEGRTTLKSHLIPIVLPL